ncbi:type IX secretion system periplasmic lipoprotein PorW/SprE [Tellurirhabdus bombi]|uniref:type IX secretion system periplasmic lipoprotein PorW/SprE n=1 Tax=Tellurirhabdus bombi TaxID=2907205 RepID=UPI001F2D2531|nr:tetratricopeptide repeat protein [Tellurirhabdus bombi]
MRIRLKNPLFCLIPEALFRNVLVLATVIVICNACSQFSTRPVPVGYHNLNARYNAYVIARDHMRLVDKTLFKNRQENYNQVLPILLPLDSTAIAPLRAQVDDAIKKASLVAERHQNSKWLDDSYLILGKARLLKEDYVNAMEVFKYVNTKGRGNDEKHEALVYLMRAYVEQGDYNNALNVAEFLRAQPLNKNNTRDYYLTKAYLHQQKGEFATAAALLDATFPFLKKEEATARLHLIAGQLYDLLGKPDQAFAHFQAVQKNRPSYEQSFYADIQTMQNDKSVSQERFSRMLDDRKNVDLKDKILYTMAQREARRGAYPQAINYWQQSIKATTTNTAQIPYTYQEIAQVYLEKLQNYPKAKVYYDSTLALLPPQSDDYKAVQNRKKVVDEFVLYQQTILTEDSLQRLAQMNPAALDRLLEESIDRNAAEKQRLQAEAERVVASASGPAATSDIEATQKWYLYNPTSISQGRIEFIQKWGNRTLDDNWRRNTRESSQPLANEIPANNGTPLITQSTVQPVNTAARKMEKDGLYAAIPFSAEAKQQSNQRLENAYYKLGKLYKFNLNKPDQAISTFETLLTRFPNTPTKPEVYYLLLLSNDQLSKASNWKEKLLAEFPSSSYARQLAKGASTEGQKSGNEATAQKTYTEIYNLYQANNVTEALARIEAAMPAVTGSTVEDKMALLRILLIGKIQGQEPYRQSLSEFIRDYPSSNLLPRVREMQVAAEQTSAKRK